MHKTQLMCHCCDLAVRPRALGNKMQPSVQHNRPEHRIAQQAFVWLQSVLERTGTRPCAAAVCHAAAIQTCAQRVPKVSWRGTSTGADDSSSAKLDFRSTIGMTDSKLVPAAGRGGQKVETPSSRRERPPSSRMTMLGSQLCSSSNLGPMHRAKHAARAAPAAWRQDLDELHKARHRIYDDDESLVGRQMGR